MKRPAFPLSPVAHQELKKTIKELLDAGLISVSRSPWGSAVFFVDKDHGTKLRMVIDFRPLNALIKRNSASLPHIKELMPHLSKAKYFSKLDLRSGYHQVLLRPENRELTAFVTPLGHYQWNVMPFGEANAPATFVTLVNQLVLKDYTILSLPSSTTSSSTARQKRNTFSTSGRCWTSCRNTRYLSNRRSACG